MIRPNLPTTDRWPYPTGDVLRLEPWARGRATAADLSGPTVELTVARDPVPEVHGPAGATPRAAYPGAHAIPTDPEGSAHLLGELALLIAEARKLTAAVDAAIERRDYAGAARLRAEWEIVFAHGQRAADALYHPAAPAPAMATSWKELNTIRAARKPRKERSKRTRPTPPPDAARAS